jgi:hypothetical protein
VLSQHTWLRFECVRHITLLLLNLVTEFWNGIGGGRDCPFAEVASRSSGVHWKLLGRPSGLYTDELHLQALPRSFTKINPGTSSVLWHFLIASDTPKQCETLEARANDFLSSTERFQTLAMGTRRASVSSYGNDLVWRLWLPKRFDDWVLSERLDA